MDDETRRFLDKTTIFRMISEPFQSYNMKKMVFFVFLTHKSRNNKLPGDRHLSKWAFDIHLEYVERFFFNF